MRAARLAFALLLAGCGGLAATPSPDAGGPGSTACDGSPCDVDAACSGGVCIPSCAPPLTACGQHCVDLTTDPHHCGSCSKDCGVSHVCGSGGCAAICPQAAANPIGPGNLSAGAGDVNGDGIPDVVSVSGGTSALSSLHVYIGRGDGTLRALAAQPLGTLADDIALADVNGDGRLDAALLTGSGEVSLSIYFNQGGGVFSSAGDFTAGVWSSALALGDLDGDGAPDAVIANSGGSQGSGWVGNDVTVLFNDGHGAFGRALHLPDGIVPSSVAIADVDGDGARDIVSTNAGDGATSGPALNLFFGDGHGSFASIQPIRLPEAGALAAADLAGTGRIDLAIAGGSSVLVLRNQGARQLSAPAAFPAPTAAGVAAADMNGDGRVDLVVGGESLAVLFNRGDATFEPAAACAYPGDGGSFAAVSPLVVHLRPGDAPDVVTVDDSSDTGDIAVWLGQPSL